MTADKGDMTPAQARRALSNLLDSYDGRKIWGALTGQGEMSLAGPEDRNTLAAIGNTLDQSEIRRKTVGDADDADPRGVEETPQGTAALQSEGMTISYPVEFGVEVVGQPGRREVELISENRLVDDLDDVMEALSRQYPTDRNMDDPREAFISDAAAAVASRLGGDLDSADVTGRVGTLTLRREGNWTFRKDNMTGGQLSMGITPDGTTDTPEVTGSFQDTNTGRTRDRSTRPRDTQVTTERPERGQQTLAEAGTTESLSEFAEGTVEDDPDRVIGPADETKRNTATTGGEFTQDRTSGLGQFEQFDATIRVGIQRDEAKTNAFGEEIPANETVVPFIIPPEGRVIDMDLKNQLERRLYDAANVPMMIDAHGAGTTVTVGTATFSDGGDTFEGFSLNSNWEGRSNV